jgi:hypothetical protein
MPEPQCEVPLQGHNWDFGTLQLRTARPQPAQLRTHDSELGYRHSLAALVRIKKRDGSVVGVVEPLPWSEVNENREVEISDVRNSNQPKRHF